MLRSKPGSAVDNFVAALIGLERENAAQSRSVRVTWLNHYSVRIALEQAPDELAQFDVCGIDGQFLKLLLGHGVRTSADLVVPALLKSDPTISTVLTIGGCGGRAEDLTTALTEFAGRPVQVHDMDGFDGLLRGAELRRVVQQLDPDLVLVGLGAGLQERVLIEAGAAMSRGYSMTCGGFLDQVLMGSYYPAWAYPLHLNWLVRLAREPRRLWRRYTVDAVTALASRQRLQGATALVPGVDAHQRMCAGVDRRIPGPTLRAAQAETLVEGLP